MIVVSLYISSVKGERKGCTRHKKSESQAAGSKACVAIQESGGVSEQLSILQIFSCEMGTFITVRRIPNENSHE